MASWSIRVGEETRCDRDTPILDRISVNENPNGPHFRRSGNFQATEATTILHDCNSSSEVDPSFDQFREFDFGSFPGVDEPSFRGSVLGIAVENGSGLGGGCIFGKDVFD